MSTELLTVGQAARRAGVDVTTIRRWTSNGQLEAQRTGPEGHRRIPVEALDALLRPETVDLGEAAPPERTLERWEQVTGGWGGWRPPSRLSSDRLAELRQSARHLMSDLEAVIAACTAELANRDD